MDAYNLVITLFLVGLVIQLGYSVFFFRRLAFLKSRDASKKHEPLSVIICARNEGDNLLDFIPIVMSQNYNQYEVIVVNDCSVDNTEDVLHAFEKKYDNFKIVTVRETERFEGGKKFALTLGIKAAQYDRVVLTDADCQPKSNEWLREISQGYVEGTEIVLGYGGYRKSAGFLNKVVRFDTFNVALQYLSFALAGKPYMGVGRNLSYDKKLFFNNKGFASHQNIRSGDDDLFINEVATKNNTTVVVSKSSHTESVPEESFKDWIRQKKRHLTTGVKYKFQHKILLTLGPLSYVLMILGLIGSIVFQVEVEIIASIFAFRLLIQMIIYFKSMDKLEEKDLIWFAPIMELILTIIYPIIFLSNLIQTENKWKS